MIIGLTLKTYENRIDSKASCTSYQWMRKLFPYRADDGMPTM